MKKLSCILLIDDDKTNNFLNNLLLQDLGIANRVLTAENGAEGLKLIKQYCDTGECPDLILLDINMPVMNGFEFLEAYHDLEFSRKQSVIVVMLTTSLNSRDVNRLQGMDFKELLNKPLTRDKVLGLLKQHFEQVLPA